MDNKNAIVNVCRQLCMISERICNLADSIEEMQTTNAELADTYENFLIDEVTHAQVAILELTRLVGGSGTANGDDSAFAEGELNAVVGKKEAGPPGEKEG